MKWLLCYHVLCPESQGEADKQTYRENEWVIKCLRTIPIHPRGSVLKKMLLLPPPVPNPEHTWAWASDKQDPACCHACQETSPCENTSQPCSFHSCLWCRCVQMRKFRLWALFVPEAARDSGADFCIISQQVEQKTWGHDQDKQEYFQNTLNSHRCPLYPQTHNYSDWSW